MILLFASISLCGARSHCPVIEIGLLQPTLAGKASESQSVRNVVESVLAITHFPLSLNGTRKVRKTFIEQLCILS
jgi:hypothetical protein